MKFLEDYEYLADNIPIPPCPKCGAAIVWGDVNWGCGQTWTGWTCSKRRNWKIPFDQRCEWQECDEADFDWATRYYSMEIGGDNGDPAGYYWDHDKKEPIGRLRDILSEQIALDLIKMAKNPIEELLGKILQLGSIKLYTEWSGLHARVDYYYPKKDGPYYSIHVGKSLDEVLTLALAAMPKYERPESK